jgi:hypothetical protein
MVREGASVKGCRTRFRNALNDSHADLSHEQQYSLGELRSA